MSAYVAGRSANRPCRLPALRRATYGRNHRRRTSWNKTYLSVVTTREGLQVIRYFLLERRVRDGHPARYECCEVMQRWIAPDGKYATVARLRNTWYYDVWRCATPLALRKEYWLYNHMPVERSYPRRRLIPELRRTGLRYDLLCGGSCRYLPLYPQSAPRGNAA